MIDLHHHLLWGLDDGARDLETSVEMARLAVANGITHVVCTPHANSEYEFHPETIQHRLHELQARLAESSIPLTLGSGCDLHLSYENVVAVKHHPTRFTINGRMYLLVELPEFGMPPNLAEVFFDLQVAGIKPILTHPERNRTLQAQPSRLVEWMNAGVLLQITADSVLGRMGRAAQKMSYRLLEQRWVHFIASDAHNTTSRPPRMRDAAELVAERFGGDYAESLVVGNPRAAFDGRRIQPAFTATYPDELRPQSWWKSALDLVKIRVRARHRPQAPAP